MVITKSGFRASAGFISSEKRLKAVAWGSRLSPSHPLTILPPERVARSTHSAATHLSAKLEVGEHDADLAAADGQDDVHQEQEAEHVVELVLPDGREDEEELDKHGSERQHTGQQRAAGERERDGWLSQRNEWSDITRPGLKTMAHSEQTLGSSAFEHFEQT